MRRYKLYRLLHLYSFVRFCWPCGFYYFYYLNTRRCRQLGSATLEWA
jgi:hypothetical protein